MKLFYCPANRTEGGMDLTAIAAQWAATLPPFVAGIDYAFCKGRTPGSGSTRRGCQRRPSAFGVAVREGLLVTRGTIRLMDVIDGTSSTIAIGEAAGSSQRYPIRDLDNPGQSASIRSPASGRSWNNRGVPLALPTAPHPWYSSVLAVTAQFGLPPDPRDDR